MLESSNFTGMVPIWFLIYIKLRLKWALHEPLKLHDSGLWGRGINGTAINHSPPLKKWETSDFRGMVPIWFLIYIILPLKWALDESSPIKLMFLFPFLILSENGNGNINFIGELSSTAHFKGIFM